MGSNPLLIHGFFEHGQRRRMTIFWIFWLARLPLSCHSLRLAPIYPRVVASWQRACARALVLVILQAFNPSPSGWNRTWLQASLVSIQSKGGECHPPPAGIVGTLGTLPRRPCKEEGRSPDIERFSPKGAILLSGVRWPSSSSWPAAPRSNRRRTSWASCAT